MASLIYCGCRLRSLSRTHALSSLPRSGSSLSPTSLFSEPQTLSLNHHWYFSAQAQQQREKEDVNNSQQSASSRADDSAEIEEDVAPNFENDEVMIVTPKQRLRDWTSFYHRTRNAKWIRNNLGIPIHAWVQKYRQSRMYQRMWGIRIQRREGYKQFWKPMAFHNAVGCRMTKSPDDGTRGRIDYDKDDLDYFFYYKPPLGYFPKPPKILTKDKTATDSADASENTSTLLSKAVQGDHSKYTNEVAEVDEEPLDLSEIETDDERKLIRAINYVYKWEVEKAYHEATHPRFGKDIYSALKEREHQYREELLKDGTNGAIDMNDALQRKQKLLKRAKAPGGAYLNPYVALPEQNYRAKNILYGGRTLDQYVDSIYANNNDFHKNPALASNEAAPELLEQSKSPTKSAKSSKSSKSSKSQKSSKSNKKSKQQQAKVSSATQELRTPPPAMSVETAGEPSDVAAIGTSDASDVSVASGASPEGDVALMDAEKGPRALQADANWEDKPAPTKWNHFVSWAFVGDKDKRTPYEVMRQIEKINVDKERSDPNNPLGPLSDQEDLAVWKKRELMDSRQELGNWRYSAIKHGKAVLPEWKNIKLNMEFMAIAAKNTARSILNDYKYVFGQGGGKAIRQGIPPQISLMEFTVDDQIATAMGAFGKHHTLFTDWTLLVDNKREAQDSSRATADIIDDRLVFDGFLMHSSLEMGHRQRSPAKDHIGFANVCSHLLEPEWDLWGYHSIGLKLRTDGRPYFLGLECHSKNRLMIFNGIIQLPPTPEGEWDYYEIPIHHFRPYDDGEFIQSPRWFHLRHVRCIGIQAVGPVGPFHLEVQWIRAFREDARFDVEDEDALFIQDIDALGLYEKDLFKFHVIQAQFFQNDFPDPFRFEDDGVYDPNTYFGPARTQRDHFARMDPDLLQYIDVPDQLPLPPSAQDKLRHLEPERLYHLEQYVNVKRIGEAKSIMRVYKDDTEVISNVTNEMLYKQLEMEHNRLGSPFFQISRSQTKPPFAFQDFTQTPNTPIDVLTRRRRKLLRELVPYHLRARDPGKYPHLV